MADTYAVVQKRGALVGPGPEASVCSGAEAEPLYSQVTPRSQRLRATPADPGPAAEDPQRAAPGLAPANQGPAWPGAYEDVVDGIQTSGLGFNQRIGRPKGPRNPPAQWTQV